MTTARPGIRKTYSRRLIPKKENGHRLRNSYSTFICSAFNCISTNKKSEKKGHYAKWPPIKKVTTTSLKVAGSAVSRGATLLVYRSWNAIHWTYNLAWSLSHFASFSMSIHLFALCVEVEIEISKLLFLIVHYTSILFKYSIRNG